MIKQLKNCTPIFEAIVRHDLEELKSAFVKFPDKIEIYTPFGAGTWLHFAANQGAFEIVKYLLEHGFEINEGDKDDGIRPLDSACSGGHYEVAKYLLDHGAVMDVDKSIRNPLFGTITGSVHCNASHPLPTGEAPQIVRLLLERGIDSRKRYNTRTMKQMDAVAFAMMMGAHDLAHIIALHHENGDEARTRAAMDEGWRIAGLNTVPVPKGEQVKPS